MRWSGIVGLGVLLAGALVTGALAAGGQTIASAPLVVSGEQNFGNTANMPEQSGRRNEYWRLQLTSGDSVTINFGVTSASTRLDYVALFDSTTNDFNVERSSSVKYAYAQSNGKGQIVYAAPRSGVYPLRFRTRTRDAGPFEFVAYIKHGVRVFMPPRATISRMGAVSVQVRNPDGAPISDKSLKITLRGTWGGKTRTLGVTTASGGLAKFKLNLPASLKGATIKVRAIAQGANYVGALSVTRSMRVR